MKSRNIVLIICFILLCTSIGLYSGYRTCLHYLDKYENILDTEGQYMLSNYDGGVKFAIVASDNPHSFVTFPSDPINTDVFFESSFTLSFTVSEKLLEDALSLYIIGEQGDVINIIYKTTVSTVGAKPFGDNYIIEVYIPRLYKMQLAS